jgi:MYXO-CTERM domain-containing protein
MTSTRLLSLTLLAAVAGAFSQSAFATVPYTENFTSDAANWRDGAGAAFANWVASGGPDGSSYITTTASAYFLDDGDPVVLFRGQDGFNSSADAFVGDWISSGINQFSMWVRHDAPVSLDFFVRFATAGNFPGTAADHEVLITPNTWTKISYEIDPSHINEYLLPEGPPSFYTSTFSNLGNIQVGYSVPAGFGTVNQSFNFSLDQLSINTPEPASAFLAMGLAAIAFMRRRRAA